MYPTTISSVAVLITKAVEDYDCDSAELFKMVGLDASKIRDPNARYPFFKMTQLWQLAARVTKDPCFGLVEGSHWHPTTMHALGYSWLASGTIKEGLERLVRYIRIVNTHMTMILEESQDYYVLILDKRRDSNDDIQPACEAVDAALAMLVNMCRASYGNDFNPIKLEMQREKPTCAKKFQQHFKAPIEYNANRTAIYFSKEMVNKELPTANTELARVNDKIITDYLAHIDKSNIDMQVKAQLIDYLSSGKISEDKIAQSINLSTRSLQRKLKQRETSFKQLLEETRKELASQYIENSLISINEITYLLGFSEPSNFSRAFKRWTGLSPKAYRQSL